MVLSANKDDRAVVGDNGPVVDDNDPAIGNCKSLSSGGEKVNEILVSSS